MAAARFAAISARICFCIFAKSMALILVLSAITAGTNAHAQLLPHATRRQRRERAYTIPRTARAPTHAPAARLAVGIIDLLFFDETIDYSERGASARPAMVHAALFISPSSSCETARIFVCNCMCISMSYHYSKYEFLGPESDLERYRFRSANSSSLLVCFDGIFRRRGAESDFRRNIPIGPNSRYPFELYS
eukprot:COSAG02_NODE_1284_length_13466_cov_4.862572_7_plen_192_part_00